MRSAEELRSALFMAGRRREALKDYRNHCLRIEDHHGVQDASSDLRELDAVEAALEWVLEARESLGY